MNEEIKDANLELLIELKRHLDQTDKLRARFDHLIGLARPKCSDAATESAKRNEIEEDRNAG